jgi:hypothetical protein
MAPLAPITFFQLFLRWTLGARRPEQESFNRVTIARRVTKRGQTQNSRRNRKSAPGSKVNGSDQGMESHKNPLFLPFFGGIDAVIHEIRSFCCGHSVEYGTPDII